MPTYVYRCTKCSHTFEKFQNIREEPLTECPQCGSKIERIVSGGAGFVLKGSGFYATDYRKSSGDTCCSRGVSCGNPKRCCED